MIVSNTGRVSTKDLREIYDGRIDPPATLVTDKMNSYVRFSNANGIELVQLKKICYDRAYEMGKIVNHKMPIV